MRLDESGHQWIDQIRATEVGVVTTALDGVALGVRQQGDEPGEGGPGPGSGLCRPRSPGRGPECDPGTAPGRSSGHQAQQIGRGALVVGGGPQELLRRAAILVERTKAEEQLDG